MRKNVVYIIMMLLLFTGENLFSQKSQQAKQQAKQQDDKSQDNNKAYFSLESKVVNFGEIKMGTTKTIQLSFTNTGKKTLVLTDVYTNCGCTTIDWPK